MGLLISSRPSTKITQSLTGDGSFPIPNGVLVDLIELRPTANLVGVKIGTTPGGEEIMPAANLVGGVTSVIGTLLKGNGSLTVYFTGITAATSIIYYRR